MKTHNASRRNATKLIFGAAATAGMGGLSSWTTPAYAARTKPFYIIHYSSGRFIHPSGGSAGNGINISTWGDKSNSLVSHARYIFNPQEGPWGFIEWANNPRYCMHPAGGLIDAGNGTQVLFHEGRHPGAYFSIDSENRTIIHRSGRYWHPKGGSAQPSSGNEVVIFDGYRDGTKFFASYAGDNQVADLGIDANATISWNLLFAEDNPLSDRKVKYTKKWGLTKSSKQTVSVESTAKLEMQGQLFGQKSKASLEVKTAYSSEDSSTWSVESSKEIEYDIKAGQPVAVWQREFNASFPDGSSYKFLSANVTSDTRGSRIRPT